MKIDAITLNSQVGFKEAVMNERTWEWQNNTYDLKVTKNETTQIWNCSPYVMICGSLNTGLDEDPEINITIEMNRNFKWSEQTGWHWHKSWNIPTITVEFSVISNNASSTTNSRCRRSNCLTTCTSSCMQPN